MQTVNTKKIEPIVISRSRVPGCYLSVGYVSVADSYLIVDVISSSDHVLKARASVALDDDDGQPLVTQLDGYCKTGDKFDPRKKIYQMLSTRLYSRVFAAAAAAEEIE